MPSMMSGRGGDAALDVFFLTYWWGPKEFEASIKDKNIGIYKIMTLNFVGNE